MPNIHTKIAFEILFQSLTKQLHLATRIDWIYSVWHLTCCHLNRMPNSRRIYRENNSHSIILFWFCLYIKNLRLWIVKYNMRGMHANIANSSFDSRLQCLSMVIKMNWHHSTNTKICRPKINCSLIVRRLILCATQKSMHSNLHTFTQQFIARTYLVCLSVIAITKSTIELF